MQRYRQGWRTAAWTPWYVSATTPDAECPPGRWSGIPAANPSTAVPHGSPQPPLTARPASARRRRKPRD